MENLIIDFDQINETQFHVNQSIHVGRIYIKNAKKFDQVIFSEGITIRTDRPLAIIDCEALTMIGMGNNYNQPFLFGGIQVIGNIKELHIQGICITNGEHGLLMSQHTGLEEYGTVILADCVFINNKKEGVYIGKSDSTKPSPMIDQILISCCQFINNGWDGLQIGRSKKVTIENCTMNRNGLEREPWQDFDLTINPICQRVDIESTTYERAQFLSHPIFIKP